VNFRDGPGSVKKKGSIFFFNDGKKRRPETGNGDGRARVGRAIIYLGYSWQTYLSLKTKTIPKTLISINGTKLNMVRLNTKGIVDKNICVD